MDANGLNALKSAYTKICFTGEGKGRFRFLSQKQSFSFESLLSEKEKHWAVAMEVPLLGQEVFEINYNNLNQVTCSGSFYERLLRETRNPNEQESLQRLVNAIANFIYFKKNQSGCSVINDDSEQVTGSCEFAKDHHFSWYVNADKFSAEFMDNQGENLIIEFKNFQNNKYENMNIFIKDVNRSGTTANILELQLRMKNCSVD